MGYFLDAFSISSGATLGSLAGQSAFIYGGKALSRQFNEATARHRAALYDPTVRRDLAYLMVTHRLEAGGYPFPDEDEEEQKDAPKTSKLLIIVVTLALVLMVSGGKGYFGMTVGLLLVFSIFFGIPLALVLSGAGKLIQLGKKFTPVEINKADLKQYAQQYWHIREYVRQALDMEKITPQEGFSKLCNTALVSQFPDSTDEIEANAFFLEQELKRA